MAYIYEQAETSDSSRQTRGNSERLLSRMRQNGLGPTVPLIGTPTEAHRKQLFFWTELGFFRCRK